MIRNEENETEYAKSYEKIETLKQLKLSYKENLDTLKNVGDSEEMITPEKIFDLKDTLIKLKHYGPSLKKMLGNFVSNISPKIKIFFNAEKHQIGRTMVQQIGNTELVLYGT